MFLHEPPPTAYDLRFRLLGADVRVHPLFWLVSVIFGWQGDSGPQAMRDVVIWVGCVFVSILVHEFGHVLMGRVFGSFGYIVLYSFGGLAVGSNQVRRWWQRVLVSLAGPGAGFMLLAVVIAGLLIAARGSLGLLRLDLGNDDTPWLLQRLGLLMGLAKLTPTIQRIAIDLIEINLWWGAINLLPVWPLDGGMVSREICERISPRDGLRISLGISIGAAALFAVHSLAEHAGKGLIPYLPGGGLFGALFFAAMAYGSYQQLQMVTPRRWPRDREDDPRARPDDWWQRRR